jgi:hypothetical protein
MHPASRPHAVPPKFHWGDQHRLACHPKNHASTAARATTVHQAQWQGEEMHKPVEHERLELSGCRGSLPHVNPMACDRTTSKMSGFISQDHIGGFSVK